ncbi:MAG: MarR family transcriptional regulator [Acidimicrobiales bacterium]|nr:MarR family transcriptional regulator [Acidimicrobiales bacterium]
MTEPMSDAAYRSLARFRHALRTFQRFSETAAREAGLTPAQHQLLLAIRGHDGEGAPSLTEVADRLQLKLHSAGELAGRAVEKGLVERWPDPTDGRRTLVGLTAAGAVELARLSVLHRDELRRFRREMNDVLRELD